MGKWKMYSSSDPGQPYSPHNGSSCHMRKTEVHETHGQGLFSCDDYKRKGNKLLEKPPKKCHWIHALSPHRWQPTIFLTNIYNKLGHSKSLGKWKNGRRKLSEGASLTEPRQDNWFLPSICNFCVLWVFKYGAGIIFAIGKEGFYPLKRSQKGMKVDEGEDRQTTADRRTPK